MVKNVAWHLRTSILFMSDLVAQLLVTLLRLISLQSMRFAASAEGTTFLWPPVSFVPFLKLSRPSIHTSDQFNIALQGPSSYVNRDVNWLFVSIDLAKIIKTCIMSSGASRRHLTRLTQSFTSENL